MTAPAFAIPTTTKIKVTVKIMVFVRFRCLFMVSPSFTGVNKGVNITPSLPSLVR